MRGGLHLFTWSGTRTFVHPTILITLALIVVPDLMAGDTGAALGGFWLLCLCFISITLHEYGHVFMARSRGCATRDITLHLFGGLANIDMEDLSGKDEILIALAGPAVNLGLASLTGAVLFALNSAGLLTEGLYSAILDIITVNVFVMVFNLIPLFPMDGGRVLRGLLSGPLGMARGTRIAVAVGWAIASVMLVFALWAGMLVFALWAGMYLLAVLFVILALAGYIELRSVREEAREAMMEELSPRHRRIEPTF